MADMSKVYIMRLGWTLCLDGIGLAISRSQVGQVRSPMVMVTVRSSDKSDGPWTSNERFGGYRTLIGQPVGLGQVSRTVGKMEGSKVEVVILILFI